MKRLSLFLTFFLGLVIMGYFVIIRLILPNMNKFETIDFVLFGAVLLFAILVGICFVLFLYRKKDRKID